MEAFKQIRVRFSGAGEENKEDIGGGRDQRIPPQKTQSFKGGFAEKRKGQNWFRRQFSREMSRDYDDTDGEYSTAVAAAAFAINNLEESRVRAQRETSQSSHPSSTFTKIKSKQEDKTTRVPDPHTLSNKISEEVLDKRPDEAAIPTPSFKKTLASDDKSSNTTGSAPSIKKTPTFADTNLSIPTSTKPENAVPKPNIQATKQSAVVPTEIKRQPSIKPGTGNARADAWEKAEMMKIKERYEKVTAKILDWENTKKIKAKRRAERREAELDRKRAEALQHYRNKIMDIDAIAGGARAQAEENRRNEEIKVKEKANKIRATGEIPVTCFCC